MATMFETDILGAILLLITGLAALIVGYLAINSYLKEKKMYHLYWGISLLVLFVSGVLIIFLNWDVLGNPLVPPVAALIPAGLAIGLLYAVYDDKPWGFYYAIYALIGIILILIAGYVESLQDIAYIFVMIVHVPSAAIIVLLPIPAINKVADANGYYFALGGLLISIGGILLAIYKSTGDANLGDLIFKVLPPLLLIVAVLFVLGIGKTEKWKLAIPYIS